VTLYVASPPTQQDFKLISQTKTTGAVAVVEAIIPEGYNYLMVVFDASPTANIGAAGILMHINGETGARYSSPLAWIATTTIANSSASTGFNLAPNAGVSANSEYACVVCLTVQTGKARINAQGTSTNTGSIGLVRGHYNPTVAGDVVKIGLSAAGTTWKAGANLRVFGSIY
jgi:hypothetical protein